MKFKTLTLATTAPLMAMSLMAQADDHASDLAEKLYLGGGFSYNTIDSPFGGRSLDATGFSGMVGLDLSEHDGGISTSMELGYSSTSDFDEVDDNISGIFIAAVAEKQLPEIDRDLSVLGRIGLDLGDDDGLMTGVGLGYRLDSNMQLRGEFINKDASNQYLASFVYHL